MIPFLTIYLIVYIVTLSFIIAHCFDCYDELPHVAIWDSDLSLSQRIILLALLQPPYYIIAGIIYLVIWLWHLLGKKETLTIQTIKIPPVKKPIEKVEKQFLYSVDDIMYLEGEDKPNKDFEDDFYYN